MPIGGLKWRDEEEGKKPDKPEDQKANGAENKAEEPLPTVDPNAAPHVKVYQYVHRKHHHIKRLKKHYFPGIAGEIVSFLFAFLVAWVVIQMLGWVLNTSNPLVVVESESMIHKSTWDASWYDNQGISANGFNPINIGDIIVVKGDNPKDITLGDVIVYTRYGGMTIGGEPVIHRVVGIADISGSGVQTQGTVKFEDGKIVTPCGNSTYSLDELRSLYSNDAIAKLYPNIKNELDSFRVFITKGDNNQNEDQCRWAFISYPVHQQLVQGRTKFDLPYVGYVKLGLVCAIRYATGNVCGCRCWWSADNPSCCKTTG